MVASKTELIVQLRKDILLLQGFKASSANTADPGLGPIAKAFPNGVFPTGAIHEFLSENPENAAASTGFVAGVTGGLMCDKGVCLWVSAKRKSFPPGLKTFGIEPDRVVFIDLKKDRDVLWVMEEGLKCEGLSAVIGETAEIGFTASRRLQLAVEQSRVTGFVLRQNPRALNTIACVARWKISHLASEPGNGMPGLGFPKWRVELERVRNGRPGSWEVEWSAGRFRILPVGIHMEIPRAIPQAIPVSQEGIRQRTG